MSDIQISALKKDEDLERDPQSCLSACTEAFLAKGGAILAAVGQESICLMPNDAVYPICSGGVCRSQALWGVLKPYAGRIVLFPPHAARHGFDPYNGQINRARSQALESGADDYAFYFGFEKAERFGFEHGEKWEKLMKSATCAELQEITDFYDQNYFGPASSWEGKQGCRRIYIAFANNAHVALHRLCSNETLEKVTLVFIDYEDLITHPPKAWKIAPRSVAAYARFSFMLSQLLDLRSIESSFEKQ
jgi:hypothetical protein